MVDVLAGAAERLVMTHRVAPRAVPFWPEVRNVRRGQGKGVRWSDQVSGESGGRGWRTLRNCADRGSGGDEDGRRRGRGRAKRVVHGGRRGDLELIEQEIDATGLIRVDEGRIGGAGLRKRPESLAFGAHNCVEKKALGLFQID